MYKYVKWDFIGKLFWNYNLRMWKLREEKKLFKALFNKRVEKNYSYINLRTCGAYYTKQFFSCGTLTFIYWPEHFYFFLHSFVELTFPILNFSPFRWDEIGRWQTILISKRSENGAGWFHIANCADDIFLSTSFSYLFFQTGNIFLFRLFWEIPGNSFTKKI